MATTLHYYRYMTPHYIMDQKRSAGGIGNILANGTEFECDMSVNPDTDLKITQDTNDYERIFKLPLVAPNVIASAMADVTVKYRIGLVYTGTQYNPDPLALTVTDGEYACGFQMIDLNSYSSNGPFYSIEGDSHSGISLGGGSAPKIDKTGANGTNVSAVWPRVFTIDLNIRHRRVFGSAYCAAANGYLLNRQFGVFMNPTKGLWMDVFRGDETEHYDLNFIEVSVIESP